MGYQMKKKILFVYHYFAHYREPVVLSINDKLSGEFDVSFVADKNSNEPSLNTMNFPNYINFIPVKNIWFGKWLWQKQLFSIIKESNPSHIVFLGQFSFVSTLFYSLFFKLSGKKILFWGHGAYGNERGTKKIVRGLFNRIPHKHLVYGNYAKKIMVKSGINQDRVSVIYNSLDYEQQKRVLSGLDNSVKAKVRFELFKTNANLPLGIFVGRLTKVKNLEMVIKCIEALNAKGNKVNFIFIGDGPEKLTLEQMVVDKSLEKQISFYGACHDEHKLGRMLYSADFCVSPGNVGLTAMHSLTYGTPVITHNNFPLQMPEFEAIQSGITGDFFEYGSLQSLIETVEKWASLTDAARVNVSLNAIRVIDELYNPTNQAELILCAVNEL